MKQETTTIQTTEVTTKTAAKPARGKRSVALLLLLGCSLCCCVLVGMGLIGAAVYTTYRGNGNDLPAPTPPVAEPTPTPPVPQTPEEIQAAKFDALYAETKPAIFPRHNNDDRGVFVVEVDKLNISPRELTLSPSNKSYKPSAYSVNGRFLLTPGLDSYKVFTNQGKELIDIMPVELKQLRETYRSKNFGLALGGDQQFSPDERYLYQEIRWIKSVCDEFECISEDIPLGEKAKYNLIEGAVIFDLRAGKYVFISAKNDKETDFMSAEFTPTGSLVIMLTTQILGKGGNFLRFNLADIFKQASGSNILSRAEKFSYEQSNFGSSQFTMVSDSKGYWRLATSPSTSAIYEIELAEGKVQTRKKIVDTAFTTYQRPQVYDNKIFFKDTAEYYDLVTGKLVAMDYDFLDLLGTNLLLVGKNLPRNAGKTNVYTYDLVKKSSSEIKFSAEFFNESGGLFLNFRT
jgi:hypothetical protein